MTGINSPAVITGINTGSVTEDNDPDRNNLLEVSGKLNIRDSDANESAFKANTRRGRYGNLSINATGRWNYAASNSQNAIQSLAADARLTDTIQISSLDGTTHNITITIKGTNDTTVISGVSTGSITEDNDPDGDNLLEVSGKLNIVDRDTGESTFISATRNGSYGSLTINANGNWQYAASNTQTAIQALKTGDTLTDTIKVSSIDGTTQDMRISIRGADDASIINGTSTGSVTEDIDPDGDSLLEVSGKLNIIDRDSGESAFISATRNGSYGSLTINANGNWQYAASNTQTAIQALKTGDTLTDTIKVSSIDGTTQDMRISIRGADDASIINGTSTGSVTEDIDPDGDSLLEVSGKLNIIDRDSGESAFISATRNGSYGSLTINANGNWQYAASNNQTAIQALKTGDTLTDTIKVSSIDGTTQDMRISIRGADDASIINGTNTGRVTEDIDPDGDNMLEVSGKLTIVDPDSGDALFANAIHLGSYGELTIDSAGNWRYEANNNQASIQNLISGTSITDTLSVSSTSGATRDIVITIAGADEASTPANITLSWIAPVEREDGTPISMSEISGYRVYYGNVKGNYTNQVVINNSADMQVTLKNLAAGTYYIVVTAYDNDGRESAYSQEKSATI